MKIENFDTGLKGQEDVEKYYYYSLKRIIETNKK
jgi:hypothetical protein